MVGHGTYERETPLPTRIRRWRCTRCGLTISCLPDCLAAQTTGSLQEVEEQVVAAETTNPDGAWTTNVLAAVKQLAPDIVDHSSLWRRVHVRVARVHDFLRTVSGLMPDLFSGVAPTVRALRRHLGSQRVLMDLRSLCEEHLGHLPPDFDGSWAKTP